MKKNLKLKGYRIMSGLTQKDMAELIGKSVSTYRKKENGEIVFWLSEIVIIAKKLNRSVNELFFYDVFIKKSNVNAMIAS